LGGLPFDPNLFSTACIIKSPTNAASMPFVVATQLRQPQRPAYTTQAACQLRSIARGIPRSALYGLLNYKILVSGSEVELLPTTAANPSPHSLFLS